MDDEMMRTTALQRLEQLKSSWISFVQTLEEVIERRDWEALGYSTFTEMWGAHMSSLPLTGQFLVHVVYQMLSEGSSISVIADSVTGASDASIEAIERQRQNGVPAEHASSRPRPRRRLPVDRTLVREHDRARPGDPDTLHIRMGQLALKRHQRLAKRLHLTNEEYGRAAIEEFYSRMKDATPTNTMQ